MYGFQDEEISTFLELLQSIIADDKFLDSLVAQTIKLKHDINSITTLRELDKNANKIELMLQHYNMLLALLIDLRRRDKIHFHQGKQKEDFLNIYLLIKELNARLQPLLVLIKKESDPEETVYKNMDEFKHYIEVFLQSEKKSINQIERELGAGISLSRRKLVELQEGPFRVEIHEGEIMATFALTDVRRAEYNFGLQIFDHDYLVAEAGLEQFIPNDKIVVIITQTYIKKRGYVQRAIELLLEKGIIKEWWSDTKKSADAVNMYLRLEKKGFKVQWEHNRFVVRK